ncbi:hypothetical protein ACIOD2_32190 [Amycolatopsis sp. NPDC088138]|uniref:hypothetical protein n=1 Tax=Amycolatopsis sp. NPDC088138 TaxID=3363938 RepID=UPI003812BA82
MTTTCTAQTGWVAIAGQVVGTPADWKMSYSWDGELCGTRAAAIAHGMNWVGSDDFNVAHVEHGVLTWFGWMDEVHPQQDWAEPAAAFDWAVPASCALAAAQAAQAEVSQ